MAAAVLAGLLGHPARAADDGYANVFSSVFGSLGLVKEDAPPEIDYRERPPLVVPPQPQLPKPVPVGSKRTAAWPQDPDIQRRRKAEADARAPVQTFNGKRDENVSKDELLKGRGATDEPGVRSGCGANGNGRGCLVVSPDELKREGDQFAATNPDKADELQPGKEPDRMYLTQPPRGYMAPTRVVKATRETPQPKLDESNPRAFLAPRKTDDE